MAVDLRWKVPKTNQLWLKWKSIVHKGNGTIELKFPEFYGPVLSDCIPIEESGYILLDLTKHFIVLIPEPYEIRLNWNKKLSQDNQKATFDKIILEDGKLGLLSLLKNNDEILIDCSNHTTEKWDKGQYKLNFPAMAYNEFKEPYDLSEK